MQQAIRLALATAVLIGLTSFRGTAARAAEPVEHGKKPERIVFLGDSITDGNTYPQLVRQALVEADKPAPICINAGVGGDTAAAMLKRLDRDVFSRRPTVVALSAGTNDVLHRVPDADFEASVTAIARRMKQAKVRLIILNTSLLGEKYADADRRLSRYNDILLNLSQKYDCPLADVTHSMHDARAAGKELLEEDQIHPNFQGQRMIARAVLDALGDNDVPVPAEMKPDLMPGVLRDWRIAPVAENAGPLDEASVAALKVDERWKDYPLPEPGPASHWWREQERRRGFALSLEERLGKARLYRGVTTVESKHRFAYLNPGAGLEMIWLNGKRVYARGAAGAGWHAGRERVGVELQPGINTIVIETEQNFFLSLTDDADW